MNKEVITRSYGGDVSPQSEGRKVCGYAIRFNEPSQNMGFIETINRNAVTQELINKSDIYAKLNHRDDVILARSRYGEGSLKLTLDERGLYYEFDAPNTIWGDELLEHIKRGEISTSSFGFYLDYADKNCQRWYKEGDVLKREIYKIDLLTDISPTFEAAYLSTSCSVRSKEANEALDEIEREEQRCLEINKKLDEQLKLLDDIFNL